MARERSEFSGAMLASTLLHAGVIVAAMISWPWARQLPLGSAVPINIVANAPVTPRWRDDSFFKRFAR